MKKFMFLLAFAFAANIYYTAVADANTTALSVTVNDEEKVEIAPTQLPAPIQEALKGADYEGWKLIKAYKVLDADENVKYYELQVSNEANERRVVKFNESGSLLD